jgi:hypothetical protein
VFFEIVSAITNVETIARGRGVRSRDALKRKYGSANWRKLKGTVRVRLADGTLRTAEVHWYEAHGIGKKEFKIKRFLD